MERLYDQVAPTYDEHFTRDVDRWEDDRLARLLRPWVDGTDAIDLGCGTGWVLDHCDPALYVGVDASQPMLSRLAVKHRQALTYRSVIGADLWTARLPTAFAHTVTATWAAHEFGDLHPVFDDLAPHLRDGCIVALHGQGPRYASRDHYVLDGADRARNYLRWDPGPVNDRRFTWVGRWGTGAAPDAWSWKPAWSAAAAVVPSRHHYGILGVWKFSRKGVA